MARARRAKAQPSRVVVPILVAAAAVAGVAVWQAAPHTTDAEVGGRPSVAATAPTPRSSSAPPPSSNVSSGDAAARLDSCRDRVRRADDVLAAADTGIGHWADHVQAQTDANNGRITVTEMDAVFARTRLAGPDDQDRYRKALIKQEDASGSCDPEPGATKKEAAALVRCHDRSDAQQPVMKAADAAMADWKSHLAAMARSRAHHMDNAEQIWLDAWQAAPPHIRAYDKAAAAFGDAPDC